MLVFYDIGRYVLYIIYTHAATRMFEHESVIYCTAPTDSENTDESA